MTEAQLNARRENAQHSTGPRTAAGKKRSSLNAFRHGLTGQIVVHTLENQEAFNKHCDGIREALAPVGALEHDLAQAIAEDRWRLNRARALENSIFASVSVAAPLHIAGRYRQERTVSRIVRSSAGPATASRVEVRRRP